MMKELNLLMVTLILQGHKKCNANSQPSHVHFNSVFSFNWQKKLIITVYSQYIGNFLLNINSIIYMGVP